MSKARPATDAEQTIARLTRERDELAAQVAVLREALMKLKNEVSGLAIEESAIRTLVGNTNWSVLMLRYADAEDLLATPAPGSLERAKRLAQGVLFGPSEIQRKEVAG